MVDEAIVSWNFIDNPDQCLPFILNTGEKVVGALIEHTRGVDRIKAFEFKISKEKIENIKPWELDRPIFSIGYPWFAYTRFFDIIVCNLADTKYP